MANLISDKEFGRIMSLFQEITDNEDREIQKHQRMEVIRDLIEAFGTWHTEGDCVPAEIKLGRFGKKYLEIRVVEKE